MNTENRKSFLVQCGLIILACMAAVLSVYFFNSAGTSDVPVDLKWIANSDQYGIVRAYAVNEDCYPPIIPILLSFAVRIGRPMGASDFTAFKATLLVFLCLTSLITFLWMRNALLALLIYFALLLNSMALGYLDIFMAPTFVAALWALSSKRFFLFSVLYTLCCLTKFQPLIIGPFLLVYLISDMRKKGFPPVHFAFAILAPAIFLPAFFLWIYGSESTLRAFRGAFTHPQISANGFNLNWIVTYFLHVFAPEKYGSLIDGRAELIMPDDPRWMNIPRVIFSVVYLWILFLFARREKTFKNLLLFSLVGYLSYFTLSVGVHENHLFLASILGLLIWHLDKRYWLAALTLVALANLNPFVFYGIDGSSMGFNPVIGIDLTIVFSAVTVVLFVALVRQGYASHNSIGAIEEPSG